MMGPMSTSATTAPETVEGLHLSFSYADGCWQLKDGATVLAAADTLTEAEALFYAACEVER